MWLLPQLRGTIQRVQLDDQMLLAAHPVVLSPAGVGQRDSSTEAGALMMPFDTSPSAAGGQQPLIRCVWSWPVVTDGVWRQRVCTWSRRDRIAAILRHYVAASQTCGMHLKCAKMSTS